MRIQTNEGSRCAVPSLCLALVAMLTCCDSASAQVAPSDPISAFLFDEGTGTTIGDSFGSNVGNFRSNAAPGTELPTWNTNAGGGETQFDYAGNSAVAIGSDPLGSGSDNWITLGNAANLNFTRANPFTISAWVSNATGGTFVSKAGGTPGFRQYQLWANSDGNPADGQSLLSANIGGLATFGSATPNSVALSTVPNTGTDPLTGDPIDGFATFSWQHVALVVESPSVAKYYVNGVLAAEFIPGSATQTNAEVLIGARHVDASPVVDVTTFFYGGYIDEVAFWDSALDQSNIDWLQTNSLQALAPGQAGDFDGDSDVDGGDFLAWQRGDSPTGGADAGDLALFESNYGTGVGLSGVSSVPEPTTVLLSGLALVFTLGSVRRRR